MKRASLRRLPRCLPLKTGGVALLLFGLLFGDSWQSSSGFIGSTLREITAILRDAETQWMVFLCLAIYFTVFLFMRLRSEIRLTQRRKDAKASWWLAVSLVISAGLYAIHYSPSTPALTLLAGAVIGQGVRFWMGFNPKASFKMGGTGVAPVKSGVAPDCGRNQPLCEPCVRPVVTTSRSGFGRDAQNDWPEASATPELSPIHPQSFSFSAFRVPLLFVLLLTLAAVWDDDVGHVFAYRSHTRWTGPWDNPNIFGLLMGTGIILALGGAISLFRCRRDNEAITEKSKSGKQPVCGSPSPDSSAVGFRIYSKRMWFFSGLFLIAASFMGRGLSHSYSRGAWLATGCGLAFLTGFWVWRLDSEAKPSSILHLPSSAAIRWLVRNWLLLGLILAATASICLWHFRQTDWHPARRALSVVNSADFSSRNRVAAWVGDLQMMAEQPWFGTGWNQPERLYEHYYLPPRLTESAAIQMNDYLMLGATLGIPALFCFAMYLGLSLIQTEKFKILNADDETTGDAPSRVAAEVTRLKLKPENRNEIADNAADADRQCSDCNSQMSPLDATHEPRLASVESAPPTVGIPRFSQSLLTSAATGTRTVICHPPSVDFLAATCRAGAVVLLVGFWFDGGLFKLPTAATFWILLELGSVQTQMETNERTAEK